jgi:cyclopropane-fatty-acyl-phospholipid synthase
MLEKTLLDRALRLIRVGSLRVTYWTGETITYGSGVEYFHLTINTAKAIRAMMRSMTLGFGESYMNGDIDIEGDMAMVGRLATDNKRAMGSLTRLGKLAPPKLKANKKRKQAKQIQHHYDLGNDFYELWLDDSMTYSCAYFKKPGDTLKQAQSQKLDHILKKLQLKADMTLLDIGSGWGQLLIKAAQDYGVTGHGITLSEEQFKLSTARIKALGLEKQIKIELINYQDLAKRGTQFDRVVSVGMFEHVGKGNHDDYFQSVDKLLKPGGITVLHTITNQTDASSDPWIDRYIFPGGFLPSVKTVVAISPKYNFQLLDYENLRLHYAMTLHEWRMRYEQNEVEVTKRYGEKFYRMWRLYLAGSESGFRWDDLGLSQFVFSKGIDNDLPLTREHLYS